MIGLPGHFLLGSRPTRPGEERIFVDPFHGGAILSLQDCAQIVAHYGVAWSAELANPVPHSEVWGRMVRNLLNCHKRNGDVDQVRTRACRGHRTPPSHSPTRISPHLPTHLPTSLSHPRPGDAARAAAPPGGAAPRALPISRRQWRACGRAGALAHDAAPAAAVHSADAGGGGRREMREELSREHVCDVHVQHA